MWTMLIVTALSAVLVSAFCSLMEAALYAVPLPHVRHLADRKIRGGKTLLALKEDMGKPIAAILILNTISNTAGAAIAGAAAGRLGAETGVLIFSIVFTLTILYCSEIIPKQIGVIHAKRVALSVAYPLSVIVKCFIPLIKISEGISNRLSKKPLKAVVSQEEIVSMADIGTEEGVLDHLEGSVIRNVIGLDRKLVKDILTPRVVVFRVDEDTTIGETEAEILSWNHTRIPVYNQENPDNITGYIIQRDIYRELLRGNRSIKLKEMSRPLTVVPELIRVDKLLHQMFSEGEHICGVVDEHGGFAGVVTLEDVVEEIVGREIVDEYDLVSDLRNYAKILYRRKLKKH